MCRSAEDTGPRGLQLFVRIPPLCHLLLPDLFTLCPQHRGTTSLWDSPPGTMAWTLQTVTRSVVRLASLVFKLRWGVTFGSYYLSWPKAGVLCLHVLTYVLYVSYTLRRSWRVLLGWTPAIPVVMCLSSRVSLGQSCSQWYHSFYRHPRGRRTRHASLSYSSSHISFLHGLLSNIQPLRRLRASVCSLAYTALTGFLSPCDPESLGDVLLWGPLISGHCGWALGVHSLPVLCFHIRFYTKYICLPKICICLANFSFISCTALKIIYS